MLEEGQEYAWCVCLVKVMAMFDRVPGEEGGRGGRGGKGEGCAVLCCAVLCAGSLQESDYIGAASNQEVRVCVLPEGISVTPAVPCAACRAVLVVVL